MGRQVTDPVAVALIAAGMGAFNGILAIVQILIQNRNHDRLSNQVEIVRKDVDGQTQALLKVTGESREAQGVLKGRAAAKAEAIRDDLG